MKSTLETWKRELENVHKDDAKSTAERVSREIGKYLNSDMGGQQFVKLVETFRVYAGKWR